MMNEEIFDLVNLDIPAQLMTVISVLLLRAAAIGGTVHKFVLQRPVLGVSSDSLSLGSSHEGCIVTCVVSTGATYHHQVLCLILSATELRPRS